MTFSIAHLSDPHITTGLLASPPAVGLNRALGRVLALNPRPACVVITGDLVNKGDAEEYAALRQVIGRFPLPLHLVAGNHDDSENMVAEFGGTAFLGGGKQTHYAVEYDGFRIVVLRTTVPGAAHGELDAEQLGWLDETLAEKADVPTFVCLHHPPFATGIPSMDAMGLRGPDALAAVLAAHPQVVRVLSGHIHRPIVGTVAGIAAAVAPSTWTQTELRLRETDYAYSQEPTAFLLHIATGGGVATHTVQVSHSSAGFGGY